MATSIADLNIRIGANTAPLAAGVAQAQGILQNFQSRVQSMLAQATAAVGGLSAAGFVGFGLKLAADVERTEAAFQVFTGSAERASDVMADLRTQAVENPLFDFAQFTDAAFSLLAMGTEVDDVNARIRVLADVSAASRQPLKELAVVFSQVQQAGRLTGGELRQFNERGVPVLSQLAEMLGVTTAQIREMTEAGSISSEMVGSAFERMTAAGGIYEGMAAKIAETSFGSFAKLSESVSMLATKIGEALLPVMGRLVEIGQMAVDAMLALDNETIRSTAEWIAMGGAITVAVVAASTLVNVTFKLVAAFRAATNAQIIMQAFSGPKGWATLAAGAVVAAAAIYGVSYAFDQAGVSAQKLAEITKPEKTVAEIDQIARAQQAAADANIKAQKETADETKKMSEYASRLTDSLRTPWEVARDEMAKVEDALNSQLITMETYKRAVKSIADTYDKATEAKASLERPLNGVGAATRFSSAGFSAVAASNRTNEYLQRMAADNRRTADGMEALVRRRGLQFARVEDLQ